MAGVEHNKYLAKASEGNIINETESAKLKDLRTQILNAESSSHKDYKVSDDGRGLFTTFVKNLKTLGDFEI